MSWLIQAAGETIGVKQHFCRQSIYEQVTWQTADRTFSDPSLILYSWLAEGLSFSLRTKQIQKLIDSCVHQASEKSGIDQFSDNNNEKQPLQESKGD